MNRSEASQELINYAKILYDKGWMMGTSGNLSLCVSKSPLEYVVTASGRQKGQLTEADFVVLGENQSPLFEKQPKPSAETALHEAIYSLVPEASAVFHVHTVTATTLSMQATQDSLQFSGLEMLKGLGLKTHEATVNLPIYENTQDVAMLASELSERMDITVPGFVLRGHGLYTWGSSPEETFNRLECWEFLFQVAQKSAV